MRKALVVGINDYKSSPLTGCENDAKRIESLLAQNYDGGPNFSCRRLLSSEQMVSTDVLREKTRDLFMPESDVALLFFAGHGSNCPGIGGVLVDQSARAAEHGLPMTELMNIAGSGKARERVIILDCCHSGAAGENPLLSENVILPPATVVLSASRSDEPAAEQGGCGLFTGLVSDALEGGAADVRGRVTVAGLYAYVDEVLNPWEQRPTFKVHASKLTPLRLCAPAMAFEHLRRLPELFPAPEYAFPLDPSYEPDAEPPHPEHEEVFGILQKFRAARLLVPIGEEHMYYAAMRSKSCRLTPLGRFYRQLAEKKQL